MLPHLKSGRMGALAVPSPKRSLLPPDVPTMAGAGMPEFERFTWASIVLPLSTPKPIVKRFNAELAKAVNSPAVRERPVAQELDPTGSPPEQVTQWAQRKPASLLLCTLCAQSCRMVNRYDKGYASSFSSALRSSTGARQVAPRHK